MMDLLDYYSLNKDDWNNLIEMGVGPLSNDKLLEQIPTNVKSALTRQYGTTSLLDH